MPAPAASPASNAAAITAMTSAAAAAAAPAQERPQATADSPSLSTMPSQNSPAPSHIQTESTLAPTSEFVRYFLLAYPSRYLFRGLFGGLFGGMENMPKSGFLKKTLSWLDKPGQWLHQHTNPGIPREAKYAMAYNAALGVGSMALTLSYASMVKRDIRNLFAESVADETGKAPQDITFQDIDASSNKIVRATVENYRTRTWSRLLTDFLFFPAALTRQMWLGDLMLGTKGIQLFADTWKRTPTMFEDLVTFINNKINPRNGLGQAIGVGEVFDLYQHYTEKFHPQEMFTNVLERGTGEGALWAKSQPIFQRITQLMNLTYAYKHTTVIDPETGHAVHQADFTLPKFIYLLGHDMINVTNPERTLTLIEIANQHGMQAVKQAAAQFEQGVTPATIQKTYQVKLPTPEQKPLEAEKNGVIAKGSTMQLDAAPASTIDAGSIAAHEGPVANMGLVAL